MSLQFRSCVSYVEWPGPLTARAVLCMGLNSKACSESCRFAEVYRRASICGWRGVLGKVDSRLLHFCGNSGRVHRIEDLGIRCCCYSSRRDIVGFEFAFLGDWQGDVCDARFGDTYRPPWYTFGSLEPREEMASAGEKPRCGSGGQARRHPGRGVSERGTASPGDVTMLRRDSNCLSADFDQY